MKRTIVMTIFAALAVVASSALTARGQTKVTIPFSFHVGSTLMPAGTYRIEYPLSSMISFQNLNGRDYASVVATTNRADAVPLQKLVFNRYGNEYFLRETLAAGAESEMTFAPTRLQKIIRAEEARLHAQGQAFVALK
jgi:hypothetical protein